MSLRHQVQNHYQVFSATLNAMLFPKWFTSLKFRLILFSLVVLFGIVYILQVSSSVVGGYKIEQWEDKIKILTNEEQHLTIEMADLSSMTNIEKRLSELSMIPASQIKYVVQKTDGVVAK